MAKRKPATRKRSKAKQTSSGMVTWLGVLALSVAAIAAYENRAKLFPQSAVLTSSKPTKQRPEPVKTVSAVPAKVPLPERKVTEPVVRAPSAVQQAFVPPMPIPPSAAGNQISALKTAAVPANRPLEAMSASSVPVAAAAPVGDVLIQPKGQQFSFCGQSGLKNCVENGRIFWRDGKKQILAGITVPRTDEAACAEERRKGFAAKVRLRDFLNSGEFAQKNLGNGASISRHGVSFEQQLLKEGLAFPVSTKNQSWCG